MPNNNGLALVDRIAVCAVAFSLVALNGRPYLLSSGFIALPASLGLIINALLSRGGVVSVPRSASVTLFLLALWTFVATLSALANFARDTMTALLWSYWLPLILYLGLALRRYTTVDVKLVILALSAGCICRFTFGAYIFYMDWGLMGLGPLMMAHFNIPAMQGYIDATFGGNTSNTASILGVIMAPLLAALLSLKMNSVERLVVITACALVGANVLITGSRAAVLVPLLTTVVAAFKIRSRWRYPFVALIVLAAAVSARAVGQEILDRFSAAARLDTFADNSVRERSASIAYGMDMMREHPLGVGPNMSHYYNPYSIAHQFMVAQGSEIGAVGAVVVVLLAIWIVAQFVRQRWRRGSEAELVFQAGAVGWMIYATTTNIPLSDGPTIAWVGLLVLFLALAERSRGVGAGETGLASAREGAGSRAPENGVAIAGGTAPRPFDIQQPGSQ